MTPTELVGLGPGCMVSDLAGHEDPDTIRGKHGGIVYAIERTADPETGELVDLYLWADPHHDTYWTGQLAGPAIQQWRLPNDASVRGLVRRLCRTVALSKGALDTSDLEAIEIAHQLTHLNRRPV